MSSKRGQKLLPSADPESLPKTAKRKKDLDNSPERWQQSAGPQPLMRCNADHILAICWGSQPDGCQAKFSGHKMRQEGGSSPGKERMITNVCPANWIWINQTPRELTLVTILTLCRLLPAFPGCCLWALDWVGCPWGFHAGHQKL